MFGSPGDPLWYLLIMQRSVEQSVCSVWVVSV